MTVIVGPLVERLSPHPIVDMISDLLYMKQRERGTFEVFPRIQPPWLSLASLLCKKQTQTGSSLSEEILNPRRFCSPIVMVFSPGQWTEKR